MNRNDWPVLENGDCEGDAEPDITCGGCGEDGYACYCGAYPQDWARFVCRYCGVDCGESGCHGPATDPDDARPTSP